MCINKVECRQMRVMDLGEVEASIYKIEETKLQIINLKIHDINNMTFK